MTSIVAVSNATIAQGFRRGIRGGNGVRLSINCTRKEDKKKYSGEKFVCSNREVTYKKLVEDCLVANPIYNFVFSSRMFKMHRLIFLHIINGIIQFGLHFDQTRLIRWNPWHCTSSWQW
jgi:hypothetical protein